MNATPATRPFNPKQHRRRRQEGQGEAGGTDGRAIDRPGPDHTGGQGLDAEEVNRAVVRQGFHDGQGDTGSEGRAGQGQGDPEEGGGTPEPQHSGGVHRRARKVQEGGAHGEEDIGIEGRRKDEDGPTRAADLEGQVLARGVPERAPQGSGHIQQVGVSIGQGEGGHGQGQGEGPGEHRPPRKPVHHHKPGRCGTGDGGHHPDTQGQHDRVPGVSEDIGGRNPGGALAEGRHQDAGQGQKDQRRRAGGQDPDHPGVGGPE